MEENQLVKDVIIEEVREEIERLRKDKEGMLRVQYETKEVIRKLVEVQNRILRRI